MIAYFKAEPTEFILAFSNSQIFQRGAGKAFWYWKPSTSIVMIPMSTIDAPFVFNETTGNFQAVTLQGQVTYRITEPETLWQLLNFTINPRTRQYLSDDATKLEQRIINIVQMSTRKELQKLTLEEALQSSEQLARTVHAALQQEQALTELGITVGSLFYTAIKATPEMTKALEAEQREALQKRADQAIYSRRADAVEQERKIKQNELATSILLAQRRRELVDLEGENTRKQAEFEAEATRIRLAPYQNLASDQLLALAFRDFATNASKIGNLTITSEIMDQILNKNGKR